jgi:hypothetical protein
MGYCGIQGAFLSLKKKPIKTLAKTSAGYLPIPIWLGEK